MAKVYISINKKPDHLVHALFILIKFYINKIEIARLG